MADKPCPAEQAVRNATRGLPGPLRRLIHHHASRAAGHNDNNPACYKGTCRHDLDVAEAMLLSARCASEYMTAGAWGAWDRAQATKETH